METKQFKPFAIVIGLMVLTSLALAYTVDVTMSGQAGIQVALPERIQTWTGDEVRYCQNVEHRSVYLLSSIPSRDVCPDCGGELYMMSIDERRVLPDDTVILKKQYQQTQRSPVTASIVLSGADRSSIHRPQLCLTGQGQEIVREWVHTVPLEGRGPLKVVVLDMLRKGRLPDGQAFEQNFYYAYWFVGKGRETHSHLMRMFFMATDRIFFNLAHRWAYISVSGVRDGAGQYVAEIDEFIQAMYPEMSLAAVR
jgi:hypothetical protein